MLLATYYLLFANMLPNPKNNKNINNLLSNPSESALDEAQVNQKKLQNKRKTIIFSLILTAGLSFLFWSYKSIQSTVKSPPHFNINFKLPKITFNKNNQGNLPSSTNLSKYIQKSPINWSIFVSLDTDYSKPVFEHQPTLLSINNKISSTIDNLNSIKPSSQSLIDSALPQGLSYQEIINDPQNIYYQGLISLPKNKILILVKINNPINSSQIQSELPVLIDHLYWYAVNFFD